MSLKVFSLSIIFAALLVISPVLARDLGEKPDAKAADPNAVGEPKHGIDGHAEVHMDQNLNGFDDAKQYYGGYGYGPRPGYGGGYGYERGYGYGRPGYGYGSGYGYGRPGYGGGYGYGPRPGYGGGYGYGPRPWYGGGYGYGPRPGYGGGPGEVDGN